MWKIPVQVEERCRGKPQSYHSTHTLLLDCVAKAHDTCRCSVAADNMHMRPQKCTTAGSVCLPQAGVVGFVCSPGVCVPVGTIKPRWGSRMSPNAGSLTAWTNG